MNRSKFTLIILLMLALGSVWSPAAAQSLPDGFRLVGQMPGVTLYQKNYKGGSPDFVQIVDLSAGASVDLLHGSQQARSGEHNKGMYGGPNPSFSQLPIARYWELYSHSHPAAFCVTNGQFFYMPESPSPLALPLKVNGVFLAEGFGYGQYPEKQLMLELWRDHADIRPLTRENLYASSAPNILGGLTEEANKKPKTFVGRTFIGLADQNADGAYELLAILTTRTANQPGAAQVLKGFGMTRVMMLDGGGSTQLVCRGQAFIDTERVLPQAIGVTAARQVTVTIQATLAISSSVFDKGFQSTVLVATRAATITPAPTATATRSAALALSPTRTRLASPSSTATSIRTPRPSPLPETKKERRETRPSDQVNMADILWLPMLMPPVSVAIFLVARQRRLSTRRNAAVMPGSMDDPLLYEDEFIDMDD